MRKSVLFASLMIGLATSIIIVSCEDAPEPYNGPLPEKFSVDIPTAITSGTSADRTKADTLSGNAIYLNLATFIAVGGGSAKLVEEFIYGIRRYALENVEIATFNSDQDNREKNLIVVKDVEFEGKTWGYMLIVTDAESESNADSGKALQIYWDHGSPIHGVAIIKPYNCDRTNNQGIPNATFRIDYDEQSAEGYDAQMEIRIAGLPMPANEPFAISTLHMFVGKKGDDVDVYGNSTHPNAAFFTGQKGFAWAFVAAGNDPLNIGVAEVGLPPVTLDEGDRAILLKDYSIEEVFTSEVQAAFPLVPESIIKSYLKNTAAPGYFSDKGFVAGGKSPGPAWNTLVGRLENLSPYNPKVTANLKVAFSN
jgi:hypothetical protein